MGDFKLDRTAFKAQTQQDAKYAAKKSPALRAGLSSKEIVICIQSTAYISQLR